MTLATQKEDGDETNRTKTPDQRSSTTNEEKRKTEPIVNQDLKTMKLRSKSRQRETRSQSW